MYKDKDNDGVIDVVDNDLVTDADGNVVYDTTAESAHFVSRPPKPHTVYPSPNVEVEARNQIDTENAQVVQAAEAEASDKAIAAAKADIKAEAERVKKIDAARAKMEADFVTEEAKIRSEATKAEKEAAKTKAAKDKADAKAEPHLTKAQADTKREADRKEAERKAAEDRKFK